MGLHASKSIPIPVWIDIDTVIDAIISLINSNARGSALAITTKGTFPISFREITKAML
jgi:hypothetical protein